MADAGARAGLLLHPERALLRQRGTEQGTVVPGRLHVRDPDVAGDEAARGRDRRFGGGLPPVVRASGQHDPVLHRQAQEVLPHVQELRHHEHLEFPMDLR